MTKPINLMLLAALASCSLSGSLREDAKADKAQFAKLPDRWQEEKLNTTADKVFQNTNTKSIIASNSVCDRYPDATLESLSKQLTDPMKNVQIEEQKTISVSQREGLYTRVSGLMDGVTVQTVVVVVRKNNCIFDFAIVSKDKIPSGDLKDFEGFVEGFRY